jgi:hypothetical protein
MANPHARGELERVDWQVAGIGRIPCKVAEGLWPGQFSVTIEFEFKGQRERLRTLAHDSDVYLYGERPSGDRLVDGEIRVRVLGKLDGGVLVRLPQETLNSGPNIVVPKSLVRGEIRELIPSG